MSDPGSSTRPEPEMDPPPDDGPGGPADMIHDDEEDFPPATPDQPRSAQVEDKHVPDEIGETEHKDKDVDRDEKNVEEGTDEPA